MIRSAILVTSAALAVSVGAAVLHGQTPQKTTNSAVYTTVQAERGKVVFGEKCSACHDPARFTGAAFFDAWDGKPLKEVWDIASGTMPEDNPGSLKQQEYGDIIAYFLHLNEFATGEAELPGNAGAMANIKVEKPKKVVPGSMKREEYVDVMAYLLKLNQFPTGAAELPTGKDALSAIVMDKP